jgi:hypothetical protein
LEVEDTEIPGRASYVYIKKYEKNPIVNPDFRKSKSMGKKNPSPADCVITLKVFTDLMNKFPKLKMRISTNKKKIIEYLP